MPQQPEFQNVPQEQMRFSKADRVIEGEDVGVVDELGEDAASSERVPSTITTALAINLGLFVVGNTLVQMARGGNFKTVRENLYKNGKANTKQAMPAEQKRLRRRKRRKK